MDRIRTAVAIPVVVFAIAAAIAISIGMLLHLVRDTAEASMPRGTAEFATPVVALLLVLLITIAGFIASAAAGSHAE